MKYIPTLSAGPKLVLPGQRNEAVEKEIELLVLKVHDLSCAISPQEMAIFIADEENPKVHAYNAAYVEYHNAVRNYAHDQKR